MYNFKCNNCGRQFKDHFDGSRIPDCKSCSNPYLSSNSEKEIVEYIKSIYNGNIIENDRTILDRKELDILLPELKLAIEFNGLYWRSELSGKDKNYHLNKTKLCKKKGIRLIHIFEDEWMNKKDIVKSKLQYLMGLYDGDRIFARNCVIKEIDSKLKSEFLNKHHTQGNDNAQIRLGAFYKNKLVAVMTFGKTRIALGAQAKENNEWELMRFATSAFVIGISGKLLKYFQRNWKYSNIISFADRRWSIGNLYDKLGFDKVSETSPSYFYFKPGSNIKFHRFSFRKSVLKNKLETFDPNLTEWQNMVMGLWDFKI